MKDKMLKYKKYALGFALPMLTLLWSQGVLAETLKTKNFNITITRKCPEGSVTCNNVIYNGTNIRTGASIRLTGKTIHTTCADGVTPCRFIGYQFRNANYLYQVTEDGALQIYHGKKLILQEKGTWN